MYRTVLQVLQGVSIIRVRILTNPIRLDKKQNRTLSVDPMRRAGVMCKGGEGYAIIGRYMFLLAKLILLYCMYL
jgi:hypothetical protein